MNKPENWPKQVIDMKWKGNSRKLFLINCEWMNSKHNYFFNFAHVFIVWKRNSQEALMNLWWYLLSLIISPRSHTMSKLSRVVKFIMAIWFLAFALAMPQAFQFGVVQLNGGHYCTVNWFYGPFFTSETFHLQYTQKALNLSFNSMNGLRSSLFSYQQKLLAQITTRRWWCHRSI